MRYSVSPECISCEVEAGAAILDLRSNTYFSLNDVGASIWDRMSEPAALEDLVRAVSDEYSVAPEECRDDIAALLDDMLTHGLIQAA